jgi:DNA-binding NtrC family response regulator
MIMVGKLKQTILYLDDDAACLTLFQRTFGEVYDVLTALTHVEASHLLSAHQADIVISDQIMPDIKGTDFLREVAQKYPESYRVLLTGGTTVGNLLHEISTGIIQLFLAKPWSLQDMKQMLEIAAMNRGWHGNERQPRLAHGKARHVG